MLKVRIGNIKKWNNNCYKQIRIRLHWQVEFAQEYLPTARIPLLSGFFCKTPAGQTNYFVHPADM